MAARVLMYTDFIRNAIQDTVDQTNDPIEYCYFNNVN